MATKIKHESPHSSSDCDKLSDNLESNKRTKHKKSQNYHENVQKRLNSVAAKKPKVEPFYCYTCSRNFKGRDAFYEHLEQQHVSLPPVVLERLQSDYKDTSLSEDGDGSHEEVLEHQSKPEANKMPQKLDIPQFLRKTGDMSVKRAPNMNKSSDETLNELSHRELIIKKNSTSQIKKEVEESEQENKDELVKKLESLSGIKIKLESDSFDSVKLKSIKSSKDLKTSDEKEELRENEDSEIKKDTSEVDKNQNNNRVQDNELSSEREDQRATNTRENTESRMNSLEGKKFKIEPNITTKKPNPVHKNTPNSMEELKNQEAIKEALLRKPSARPSVKQTPKRDTKNVMLPKKQKMLPKKQKMLPKKQKMLQAIKTDLMLSRISENETPERSSSSGNIMVKTEVQDSTNSETSTLNTPFVPRYMKTENSPTMPLHRAATPISDCDKLSDNLDSNKRTKHKKSQNYHENLQKRLSSVAAKKPKVEPFYCYDCSRNFKGRDAFYEHLEQQHVSLPSVVLERLQSDYEDTPLSEDGDGSHEEVLEHQSKPEANKMPQKFDIPQFLRKTGDMSVKRAPNMNKSSNEGLNELSRRGLIIKKNSTSQIKKEVEESEQENKDELVKKLESLSGKKIKLGSDSFNSDKRKSIKSSKDLKTSDEEEELRENEDSEIKKDTSEVDKNQNNNQVQDNELSSGREDQRASNTRENTESLMNLLEGKKFKIEPNITTKKPNPVHKNTPNSMEGLKNQKAIKEAPLRKPSARPSVKQTPKRDTKNVMLPKKQKMLPKKQKMLPKKQKMLQAIKTDLMLSRISENETPERSSSSGNIMVKTEVQDSTNSETSTPNTPFVPGYIKTENSPTIPLHRAATPILGIIKPDPETQPATNQISSSSTATQSFSSFPVTKIGDTIIDGDSNDEDDDCCVVSTIPAPDVKPVVCKDEKPTSLPLSYSTSYTSAATSVSNSATTAPSRFSSFPSTDVQQHAFNWNSQDVKLADKRDTDRRCITPKTPLVAMPLIHNVQGAKLNVDTPKSPIKKKSNNEANVMANVLASRGISVTRKQKSRTPSPERILPNINLGEGISIRQTSKPSNFTIPERKVGDFTKSSAPSHVPASNREMGLPVVDLSQEDNLRRLSKLGIYNFIPLANREQANGCFGIPVISVSTMQSGMTSSLQALGADGLLSLGPLKHLPNL